MGETQRGRSEPGGWELTLAGGLGPVLRTVVTPCTVSVAGVHTIVRAQVPEGTDLVDLLGLLESAGLEITQIAQVD